MSLPNRNWSCVDQPQPWNASEHSIPRRSARSSTTLHQRITERFHSPKFFASAALLLLLSLGLAEAQTRPPNAEELMNLSFDELLKVKVDKVYGASKYAQPTTQAPSSITIVDSTQIKRFGYRTLAEILRSVRGFYTRSDRNYSYVGLRGFLRPDDGNSRILFLVNGHRINDNINDAGAVGTDFLIDVDLIERVEVVRGPSSALYGNSAFFAVINIVTKQASDFSQGEVSGEIGSFDTYKVRFSLAGELHKKGSLLVSGTYFDRAGEDSLYYPEFDSPDTNFGIARNLNWDKFYNFYSQYQYASFTLDAGINVREKGIPTAPFETVFNHPDNSTEDLSAFINARHVHQFSEDLELTSRLSYGQFNFDGSYMYEGDLPTDPDIIPNFDHARGIWLIGETILRKRFLEKHQAIGGFEYRYDIRRDQRNFDRSPAFEYLNSSQSGNVWSPFATMEFNIRTNLMVNVGVRHDHYDTFGGTTNPRAALIYQPRSRSTLKYVYGEAFRAPNAFELYYGDSGYTAKANPTLSPEEIKTHEFIWEEQIGTHFGSSISLFHYDINNLISQSLDPIDDLLVYNNIEAIRAQGFEVEFSAQPDNGLQGKVSYAFQQGENLSDAGSLINSPSHLLKFNLAVPLWKESVFLGWETLYTSSRKAITQGHAKAFWLNNITLFGHEIRPGLELSASVYNLFDERYFESAGPEHAQALIEQEGRTFRVKLSYHF